jgi:hypothetical protein
MNWLRARHFSLYPRIATFANPASNSDQTSCPPLTRSQQRTNARALNEKGTAVRSIADTKGYTDILGTIPALSNCTRVVLDEFVASSDCAVRTARGTELRSPADADHTLYVLVGGSASLHTNDGLRVTLESGDFFGGAAARRHGDVIASVVAHEDAEFLAIGPAQVLQLRHASTRRSHPSNVDWTPEPLSPSATFVPRRRRFAVLTNSTS